MSIKTLRTIKGACVDIDTSDQALIDLGYGRFVKKRNLTDLDEDDVDLEGVAFGDGAYDHKKVAWFSFATNGLGFFYSDTIGPDDFKVRKKK